MADIVQELRTLLVANAGVTAAVAQRIYQDRIPQGMQTLPAVVLDEVSGTDEQALDGEIVIQTTRVRGRCYATTPTSASSVRALLVTVLATFRGIAGTRFINGIELAGKGNGIDPPIDDNDTWRPYRWQDFLVTHRA